MKSSKVRNFSVVGHLGAGKTSLCDLMLYKTGAVDRLGKVTAKTSVSDYTPEEQSKVSSIFSSMLNCKWKDHQFYFIDTPGYSEFIAEPIAAIQNSDMALIAVDAVDGIQIGSASAWKIAQTNNIPRAFLINGVDKELADYEKVLGQIQETYGKTVCIPITVPVGEGASFEKVINILRSEDVPPEAARYREELMDNVAESDEELMMRYLDGEKLTEEEISNGVKKAIQDGNLVPVFVSSVEKDLGVEELMTSAVNIFPAPLARGTVKDIKGDDIELTEDGIGVAKVFKSITDPFLGQLAFFRVYSGTFKSDSEIYNVTKSSKERFGSILILNGKNQSKIDEAVPGTIGAMVKLKSTGLDDTLSTTNAGAELGKMVFPSPVMSYAITAVKSGEEDKIGTGLNKLTASDPTLKITRNAETHEILLSGMGDQHLGLVIKKLKEDSKVDVNTNTPKVAYRETITANGEGHYRHKKQTGGSGQFAEVYLKVAPNADGYEFKNAVVGGNIPKNYIPAVEKGVVESMVNGPLVGCNVENLLVTVYDGKYHDVDSNEMAFKIAARAAFKDAMQKAKPIILEPIQDVKIIIPDQYMGDVSGDLNQKRGRILGMGVEEGMQVVNAEVPLAELPKYATELRSMTQGNGSFEMEFARYEMVPTNIANQIIDTYKQEQEEANK
jgi:elongation factor G